MTAPSKALRAATYNIHSCVGGDRRYDPQRVLHVLREIDADILALQEVGGHMVDELEQLHFFETHLGMKAIAGLKPRRLRAQFGNAVLVKGEVLRADLIELTVYKFEPRNAIDCEVETAAGRMRVIATHLGLSAWERRRQIAKIAELLPSVSEMPLLLLGDFNVFGREREILHSIGAPKPLPKIRSFPARRPLLSLDRLWTIPNDHLKNIQAHRSPNSHLASDHLPLVGDMEFGHA